MLLRIPRMAPHIARHVAALARLGLQDAGGAARVYGGYATRLAVAGVAAFLAVLMACAWLLAAVWDTGYRVLTAGLLFGAFALAALLVLSSARRQMARQRPFAAVKRNLALDRELYAELRPEAASEPTPPPEVQLAESRAGIRHAVGHSQAAGTTLRFPRSRTMQMLTRGGPAGSAALLAYLLQRRRPRRRGPA